MGMRSSIRNGFKNPTSLPAWWSLVAAVAMGVFVIYAAVSAIPRGQDNSTPVTRPQPTVTSSASTTPATSTPADSGSVSVSNGVGGTVEVPVAALQTATAGVRAMFTGDFSTVELAAGSSFPSIGNTWVDPQVSDVVSVSPTDRGGWRFVFDIDPDGASSEVPRRLGISVEPSAQGWSVRF